MKENKLFYDVDREEVVTIEELIESYNNYIVASQYEKDEFTLSDYINDCTSKNGSLEEIREKYYLDYSNDSIVSIWDLYKDYTDNYKEDYKTLNSFIDYCIYYHRVLVEIQEEENTEGITPIQAIKHIMEKYSMDAIGAYTIIIQLIDDGLYYDTTLSEIDSITSNYYTD